MDQAAGMGVKKKKMKQSKKRIMNISKCKITFKRVVFRYSSRLYFLVYRDCQVAKINKKTLNLLKSIIDNLINKHLILFIQCLFIFSIFIIKWFFDIDFPFHIENIIYTMEPDPEIDLIKRNKGKEPAIEMDLTFQPDDEMDLTFYTESAFDALFENELRTNEAYKNVNLPIDDLVAKAVAFRNSGILDILKRDPNELGTREMQEWIFGKIYKFAKQWKEINEPFRDSDVTQALYKDTSNYLISILREADIIDQNQIHFLKIFDSFIGEEETKKIPAINHFRNGTNLFGSNGNKTNGELIDRFMDNMIAESSYKNPFYNLIKYFRSFIHSLKPEGIVRLVSIIDYYFAPSSHSGVSNIDTSSTSANTSTTSANTSNGNEPRRSLLVGRRSPQPLPDYTKEKFDKNFYKISENVHEHYIKHRYIYNGAGIVIVISVSVCVYYVYRV
jgi:hypothetical protein